MSPASNGGIGPVRYLVRYAFATLLVCAVIYFSGWVIEHGL